MNSNSGFVNLRVLMILGIMLSSRFGFTQIITTAPTLSYSQPTNNVHIYVTAQNIADVAAISLKLSYNPAVFQYTGYSIHPALLNGTRLVNASSTSLSAGWYSFSPITIPGTDTLITFHGNYLGGSCPLNWVGLCEYANLTGTPLTAVWVNGSISVNILAANTMPATNITDVSAKLHGQVNTMGPTRNVFFKYGVTSNYGNVISSTPSSVSGVGFQNVYADISGLTEGTLYHFRVFAASPTDTISGNDLTFTTPVYQDNILGSITYFNAVSTPLYNLNIALKNMSGQVLKTTTTDYLGRFSFYQPDTGQYQIGITSAISLGGISSTDALLAMKKFLGLLSFTGIKLKAADVDNNNQVNSTDALWIMKKFLNTVAGFPAGSWVFETANIHLTGSNNVNVNVKGICYGDLDGSYTPPGCSPMPTVANAGQDQVVTATSTNLEGNTATSGTGTWAIIQGNGGVIAQLHNPSSSFNGQIGTTYTLTWTIGTTCTSTVDTVQITFCDPALTSNAGPDQTITGTSATLAANVPVNGTGTWYILSGFGGNLSNPNNPASTFTGLPGTTYTLMWMVSSPCGSAMDTVNITFLP